MCIVLIYYLSIFMKNLSPGKNPPELINVVVEIPARGTIKYEVDEETGVLFVDRFLHTPMYYPFNYGFMPGTAAEDGDSLDIIVLSMQPVQPGVVIPATPIAVLGMEDEEGPDDKIVAVPPLKIDPVYGKIKSADDIDQHVKDEIKHFFEHYKDLEPNKWVKITDWKGKEVALEEVKKGMAAYK